MKCIIQPARRSESGNVSSFGRPKDESWIKEVSKLITGIAGAEGNHPYYDELDLDYITYGTEPERGKWRKKFLHTLTRHYIEIEIDDDSLSSWVKLSFHNTNVHGTTLEVSIIDIN